MGYYVELARKFLIEGRLKAAKFLLDEQLNNNLSAEHKRILHEKISESKLTLPPDDAGGHMLTQSSKQLSLQENVKLIAYVRERDRILRLS